MTKTQALKLVEITSQRQADNGTVCYFDPIANCKYMSYESGYVRRQYQALKWRTHLITNIYQVNKTRQAKRISEWSGCEYFQTERILIPTHEDRLDLICRATVNFRQSLKKYANA
jgi:hypothetical protein